MIARQIPLHLLIEHPLIYLAHPWSSLDEAGKDHVAQLVTAVQQLLEEFGFDVYVSSHQQPPGLRRGDSARQLWLELRDQMNRSHLILIIRAEPSEGAMEEHHNANDVGIPTVMLVQRGFPRHELSWSPSTVCLAEIPYSTNDEALSSLSAFLSTNNTLIREQACLLERARADATKLIHVGATVQLHRERLGWSIDYLARRAVLPRNMVAAIENDAATVNPPIGLLARIAYALDISLEQLFRRPQDWLLHEVDVLVAQVAEEENWPVGLVRRFHESRWPETRSLGPSASLEDTREEMRRWRKREEEGQPF